MKIIEHWRQAHSALPSWFLLCLPGESVCLSIFCSAPALPRPSSLLPHLPTPVNLPASFYLQTSVHRCLPLLTTTKLTKKLEKARKTRPFIDSLVEGSRPQHTPPTRTLPPTSLHFSSSSSRARALPPQSQGHATDLAHRSSLHTLALPTSISQTNVRWSFSLSLPHPEYRALHFAHFVSFSLQQAQEQAPSRPRGFHQPRHYHHQPADARTVSLDSHV